MKYRLYQIDPDRDHDRVKFLGLAVIEKYQGTPEVNRSIYDMVYEGELGEESDSIEKTLEDLFFRFNCRLPDDFRSRRMSVSDVVEVIGENGAESSFWYCDNVGFKQIPFMEIRPENAEHCICCGDVIPEGRQICMACESGG